MKAKNKWKKKKMSRICMNNWYDIVCDIMASRIRSGSIRTRGGAQRAIPTPPTKEIGEHELPMELNVAQPREEHPSIDSHDGLNRSSAGMINYFEYIYILLHVPIKKNTWTNDGYKVGKKRKSEKVKPSLEIPKDLRRVVGDNAQQFITETSQIVKQHAPLNVEKWSKIPTYIIDKMIQLVNEKFNLPDELHTLGLELLINYWSDPKFKRVSEANKANRAKQTIIARVGTMSIARNIHKIREPIENLTPEQVQELEQKPEYMRLWEKSLGCFGLLGAVRVGGGPRFLFWSQIVPRARGDTLHTRLGSSHECHSGGGRCPFALVSWMPSQLSGTGVFTVPGTGMFTVPVRLGRGWTDVLRAVPTEDYLFYSIKGANAVRSSLYINLDLLRHTSIHDLLSTLHIAAINGRVEYEGEGRVSEDAENARGEKLVDMVGGVLESIVEDEDEVPGNVGGSGGDTASCHYDSIGLHH
uniref:Uncharacterized protein n=1 Tax=Ananas comosus var. bracteatus TaxID=296719 RepID=A0A6V7QIB4_ANACO|nr:unnamed protein product [Ananas comosus var. bracteatus]